MIKSESSISPKPLEYENRNKKNKQFHKPIYITYTCGSLLLEWVFELVPNEYEIMFSVMFGLTQTYYTQVNIHIKKTKPEKKNHKTHMR